MTQKASSWLAVPFNLLVLEYREIFFFLGGGCVFKQPTIKCMILGA